MQNVALVKLDIKHSSEHFPIKGKTEKHSTLLCLPFHFYIAVSAPMECAVLDGSPFLPLRTTPPQTKTFVH